MSDFEHIQRLGAHPEPGQPCPACKRRVPFEKTEKSPPTKKKGYWVPADEFDAHEEVLGAAAAHLGVVEQPFHEFKTVTLALALVLQDESLRGFAQRRSDLPAYHFSDEDAA